MPEELLQDKKTVDQIIDDFTLFDDDLMAMVFDDNKDATEFLLKIILKRNDIIIINVTGQRELKNPIVSGRNIRLDILAKDTLGKYYNVEVQKNPEGAHIRRARFNSSMMDARMLKEGQEFKELRDSYMVFFTQTDLFGHDIPIYTINRHFEEIDDPFDDGSHIIYVNGSYKGTDPIGKLIHDFGCKKSADMYSSELAKGVKHFKEEDGRKLMSEAVEKYAKAYAEKYAEQYGEKKKLDTLYGAVLHLMETLKLTAEQAMDALCVSPEERVAILKRL